MTLIGCIYLLSSGNTFLSADTHGRSGINVVRAFVEHYFEEPARGISVFKGGIQSALVVKLYLSSVTE